MNQPWIERPSTSERRSTGCDERELVQYPVVERGQSSWRAVAVLEPHIGQLDRARTQVDVTRLAPPGDGVERRDVVPARGDPPDVPVGGRDAPELVAAVDRCREADAGAVRGGPQPSRLAPCEVAPHTRARHQVVPPRQVPAARRPRLGSVGREQPDVVAAPAASLELRPECRDRLAVGQPGRAAEDRAWTAGHGVDAPARDVGDVDRWPEREVVIAMALGHERDAGAVRRPRGLGVRHRPVGQAAGLACGHVDQPQVTDPVVLEPGPVEHVVEPVDEAVGRSPAARRAWACASCLAVGHRRRRSRHARSRPPPGDARPGTTRTPRRRAAGR